MRDCGPVITGADGAGPLRSQRRSRFCWQHPVQLVARADIQLGEDLAEVVLDRSPADEQPRTDLGVGDTVASQPRDLRLLSGELVARLDVAFACALAGRQQFPF